VTLRHALDASRDRSLLDRPRASRSIFREIAARFADASTYGAQSYARQALRVQPEADPAQLAQDAVSAITEFIAALELPN
jgi:hypothetical protein